ncbi:MAG: discoidin domain-containing protein [Trueperaceae bacterium]|nr:discoidin domain-containing protein [Trueperaceae bacterium]
MPRDLDPVRTAVARRRTFLLSRLTRHLPRRVGATVLLAAVLAVLTGFGHARSCAEELEPNDELHRATPVGDERCMVGALDDAQDVFVWDVSAEDAAVPWVVEIEGIEDQLTQLDLVHATFADDGVGVTAADKMWTFGTTTGRLNRSGPILLPPGPLYLGLSKSGGEGRYVLSFVRQDRTLDRDHRPFDRIDTAQGAFGAYGPVEAGTPRELTWELSEEDAGLLWGVEGQTSVDGDVTVELIGPDGSEVAQGTLGPGQGTAMGFLGLAQGTYTLRIAGEAGTSAVRTVVQGRPADGSEVEPNDDRANANPMRLGEPFDGVAERTDWIVVDVPEERAEEAFDLTLEADGEVTVVLRDENGEELLSRRGSSGSVAGLVLGAGIHYLTVAGSDAASYRVALEPGTTPRDGYEAEPNDVRPAASPMGEGATLRGTLQTQDTDVMRFEIGDDAGLWRVQAIGDGLADLAVYDSGGRRLGAVGGSGRLRLDNLVLEPGSVYVEVGGEGDWAVRGLRTGDPPSPPEPAAAAAADADPGASAEAPLEPAEAAPSGPADPSDASDVEALADPGPPAPSGWIESEPNDGSERSQLLPFGTTRVGTLTDGDRDVYRFTLLNDAYVRIEAVPPEDGQVTIDVSDADRAVAEGPGRPAVFEGWLLAGDYDVVAWPEESSDGWYQLRGTMLDPIALPVDVEPNHDARRAAALPADLRLVGTSGTMGDADVYALPTFDAPTVLEVRGEVGGARVSVLGDADADRADDVVLRATLAAGGQSHLRLTGRGSYDLQLSFDREPDPRQLRAPAGASGLDVSATVDASDVAAYWGAHQVVHGELRIGSDAGGTREVRLEAVASLQPVEVTLPDRVQVEAGASTTVPFQIRLPDDVRDDQPLRITLGARSDDGVATTTVALAPICEAAPVAPVARSRVPAALAGHHNVAWAPFGATVIDSDAGNDVYLNDGWTSPGRGASRDAGDAFVLDLPGDEPIELSGTLLHPQSRAVLSQLRRFRIETSLDGESWETVLEDSLDAARVEQAFVFDRPVRARYARLVAIDDHDGRARRSVWLGEWKLLSGSWSPSEPIDLAAQRLGGVVVSSDPLVGENAVLPDVDRTASIDGRGHRGGVHRRVPPRPCRADRAPGVGRFGSGPGRGRLPRGDRAGQPRGADRAVDGGRNLVAGPGAR